MRRILSTLFALATLPGVAYAASLAGVVVDARDHAPIADARVEIVETGTVAVTGSDGRFAVEAPATAFTLVVSRSGFKVSRQTLGPTLPGSLEIALASVASFADRVEVTANRAQTGRDPITTTNISSERVKETYWGQDPALLLAAVAPGLYAYNDSGNGIGYSYFWVRGFNQAQSRVTLNGAPLNDADSGELFFIDLADFLSTAGDVQVQRGVFGLSGIGGAIDITTAPPSVTPSFTIHSGFGSFGTRRLSLRLDSGLIEGRWAISARYSKVTTDGYRDRSWVDQWNYYLAAARYDDRSTLRLVLFGGPERTHLAYDGVPKSVLDGGLTGDRDRDRRFNPLTYPGEIDNFTQPHFQLLHDVDLSPNTRFSQTLYSYLGNGYYDEYRTGGALGEYDLPDVTLPDGTVIATTNLVRRRTVDEWDAGWVPTLRHTAGDWTFTLRGEAREHQAHHYGAVTWAQYYPADVAPDHRYYDYRLETRTAALAGEATWIASPLLTIEGGLEFAHHSYAISHDRLKGVAFTDSFDFVLPRLGGTFHLGAGTDAYVNVARGMHEPAFREIYDPQDYYGERANLDPEDVWDWEAGVVLQRPAWRLRANLFWMAFANEIVYAGALDDSGVPIYGNGARSRHRGVEMDGSAELSGRLAVEGALTLSHNTFTRYREYESDGSTAVYDGNRIAGFPDVIASLTLRWRDRDVLLLATGRHVGRFYLDNSQDNRRDAAARQASGYVPLVNPAATTLDLAAQYSLPAGAAKVFGFASASLDVRLNNALDRLYTAFGYVDNGPVFIPAATRNLYIGLTLGL
jgi:iron complex outermembrane recepter protein